MAEIVAPEAHQRAEIVMARCEELGRISDEAGCLTRRYGLPALRAAQDLVAGWMIEAGMATRRDPLGNLIGRYEAATPDAPALLLGSHLDTVRDAGKYDGPLGVLVALAAVERLAAQSIRLPFAIELPAFADEEGLRFHTDYVGSRAYLGAVAPDVLDRRDDDGISLADAIRAFGGDPVACTNVRSCPPDVIGYVELHIEQGPSLEAAELPVGVVTAIAGATRFLIELTGVAGHAGTVAMSRRRDALCAAAELILAAEAIARATPELVATVGQLSPNPGASNVIPGHVRLSLDIRHPDNDVRASAIANLRRQVDEACKNRGVTVTWEVMMENRACPCDPKLADLLADAVAATGFAPTRLPSGAGHDGVALSTAMPFAMLFVRCAGGISHNPAESVTADDVAIAIAVFDLFLTLRAATTG